MTEEKNSPMAQLWARVKALEEKVAELEDRTSDKNLRKKLMSTANRMAKSQGGSSADGGGSPPRV